MSEESKATGLRSQLQRLAQQEDLNFLLTNRIPRIALTRWMGWWSGLRHPWVVRPSLFLWKLFGDLDLSEAKQTEFASLQECFTRELKPGLRPLDPDPQVITSPCDAILGSFGRIEKGQLFQAKGFPYRLESLLGDGEASRPWAERLAGGHYATLRLTSSMYHRFHAPCDAQLRHVTYLSGDAWNVNPIALQRVQQLFCKNERAVLHLQPKQGSPFLLVPVAAILVASLRLHALQDLLHLRYQGPHEIPCHAEYEKGDEMGWFQHGSTIILLFGEDVSFVDHLASGKRLRMGEALLRHRA